MFREAELEQLRRRKVLLVLQCDVKRVALTSEWRRIRSLEFWWSEAGGSLRRHPLLTAVLGVGAGVLAIQVLRRPGAVIRWIGRLGGASTAWSVLWRLFGGGERR